jgi:prepilin-type N-terminal cleavage/methylation domain-containing protein
MLFVSKKQTGFTIVELLIVIVVIGILAAIVIVAFNGVQQNAATGVLKSDLRNAATELELAKVDNNDQYPDDEAGILASSGTTYMYTSNGSSYCLTAFSNINSVASQYISSTTNQVTEGACEGHSQGSASIAFPLEESAILLASDAAASDRFGVDIAVHGDVAVIGAYTNSDAGAESGSAYVFTRSGTTWTEQAKLTASDAAAGDRFGYTVSVSGETVVVGANGDSDQGVGTGAAYVFTRSGSTWTEQAKLTASDAAGNDRFGYDVALSGDTVVIGSYWDDVGGTDSGSAYVFTRSGTTWTEQAKLTASDAAASDNFGRNVDIHNETAVVGAYWNDDAGSNSGSAYVFTRSGTTWTEQAKLTASDAETNDRFGNSVAISDDSVVIGAYTESGIGASSGSAYVFTRSGSTWTEQAKLLASDTEAGDQFGGSVAMNGDTVAVGATSNDDAGSSSGSAYVFTRSGTTWTEQAKLTASDAAASDLFGGSVAMNGDTLLVGATLNDDAGSSSGSAYVFD